ncbi:MAG: hypothetical protein ACK5LS_02135 [Propioniciclava sp.]
MAEDPPRATGSIDDPTFAADLDAEAATEMIGDAVRGRRRVARRYLQWLRRRHPDATPAEIIAAAERHYQTAIGATRGSRHRRHDGCRGGGVGDSGRKERGLDRHEVALRALGTRAAAVGAQKAVTLLPAGDQQLQFEVTSLFALALADLHSLDLDDDQARALVYGLSSDRLSQADIASMAADLATAPPSGPVDVGQRIVPIAESWEGFLAALEP